MNSIQYNGRTSQMFAAIKPGVIRVWDIENKKAKHSKDLTFSAVGETPYTLLSIDEQNLLVVTTRSKSVCFVKIDDGSMVETKSELIDGIAAAVLRKQAKLVVTDNKSNKFIVLNLQ
jgi:uncharacterized protein YbbK (DUF523 family)